MTYIIKTQFKIRTISKMERVVFKMEMIDISYIINHFVHNNAHYQSYMSDK